MDSESKMADTIKTNDEKMEMDLNLEPPTPTKEEMDNEEDKYEQASEQASEQGEMGNPGEGLIAISDEENTVESEYDVTDLTLRNVTENNDDEEKRHFEDEDDKETQSDQNDGNKAERKSSTRSLRTRPKELDYKALATGRTEPPKTTKKGKRNNPAATKSQQERDDPGQEAPASTSGKDIPGTKKIRKTQEGKPTRTEEDWDDPGHQGKAIPGQGRPKDQEEERDDPVQGTMVTTSGKTIPGASETA